MKKIFILLLLLSSISSCSEINQKNAYRNWNQIPEPVKNEFRNMLADTADTFIYCSTVDKRKKCNFKSKNVFSQKINFQNGEINIVENPYETTLKFFVFYNDTLYSSIKTSLTGKQSGKSREKIVNLDTLQYKLIWKN